MTADTGKSPYDAEIAALGGYSLNESGRQRLQEEKALARAYRRGYADAEARHAPLLEAAKVALDYLANPSYVPEEGTTRLKASQALQAAIAAYERKEP